MEPVIVDELLHFLENKEGSLHVAAPNPSQSRKDAAEFPKDEILRRFEEDRERVSCNRSRQHSHLTHCIQLPKHKLLRQKRWHVPVPAQVLNPLAPQPLLPKLSSALSLHPPIALTALAALPTEGSDVSMTSQDPSSSSAQALPVHAESALDIEFDNAWETTSDWNEDDEEAAEEENFLCFGPPQSDLQSSYDASSASIRPPQDFGFTAASLSGTNVSLVGGRAEVQDDLLLTPVGTNGRGPNANMYPPTSSTSMHQPPPTNDYPSTTIDPVMQPSHNARGLSRQPYAAQGNATGYGRSRPLGNGNGPPSSSLPSGAGYYSPVPSQSSPLGQQQYPPPQQQHYLHNHNNHGHGHNHPHTAYRAHGHNASGGGYQPNADRQSYSYDPLQPAASSQLPQSQARVWPPQPSVVGTGATGYYPDGNGPPSAAYDNYAGGGPEGAPRDGWSRSRTWQ